MSTRVGRISQLDQATLLKLQAGCNYINSELAKTKHRVISATIVTVLVAAAAYSWSWQRGYRDPRLPIGAPVALGVWYGARQQRQLAKNYKHIVVRRVVSALGHGLTYSADSRFSKQDFLDMDLFKKKVEKWTAEDEICGSKNNVTYSILEGKATRTEGAGKNRRTVTIFDGAIVRLDFNKHFHGHTVVVPDSEGKALGGLLGEAESWNGKTLARMEDVEFEKLFSVYTTDQQEARYILTPKLMELVVQARATLGAISMSFHDNSVFVAIPQSTDRFEVSLFGSQVSPESVVGDLAEVVALAERLVDQLQLETRIWSRV